MNVYPKIALVVLSAVSVNANASYSNAIGNALAGVVAPLFCAPSKKRLEAKEVYKAGDLVRIVHGANLGSKGKVVGSFLEVTQKSTPQDVLEALKKNKEHVGCFFLSLMPHKDRAEVNSANGDDKELEKMTELLLKKSDLLLDAKRLYKIDIVKKFDAESDAFEYEHVACLQKIDQSTFDDPDSGFNNSLNDEDFDTDNCTIL